MLLALLCAILALIVVSFMVSSFVESYYAPRTDVALASEVHEASLLSIRRAYENGLADGRAAALAASKLAADDDLAAYLLGQPVRESLADYHDYVAEKAMDAADHTAAIMFEYERGLHAQETACALCGPRCDCIPF